MAIIWIKRENFTMELDNNDFAAFAHHDKKTSNLHEMKPHKNQIYVYIRHMHFFPVIAAPPFARNTVNESTPSAIMIYINA